MGLAWWALDFPFMKRYSPRFLKKNPHLKGKDVEITRKACEKFKIKPISIMNFLEGTRFTPVKHDRQKSPFTHLLKPKAGGIAFVLGAMGDCLNSLLNITIAYPQGIGSFWDFLCGRVTEIRVHIEKMAIPRHILGDYEQDPEFRKFFQNWVNDLWTRKDVTLAGLLKAS
jgi:1-acyl-sn-glycerol-3-phosphate acyltransferase